MITRGWLEEVEANLRRGEPMWRETGDGHGTTLIATEAGLQAIGIEPVVASAVASARKAKLELVTGPKDASEASPNPSTAKPVAIRTGTKQAEIIALIQRPEGATIAEIAEATGWLAHTVRGSISGALKKKLRLPITAEKVAGRGTVYRCDYWLKSSILTSAGRSTSLRIPLLPRVTGTKKLHASQRGDRGLPHLMSPSLSPDRSKLLLSIP
jgi:hypothetical protein